MSTPHAQPNPMDPMLSFWKEAWARMAVAAPAGGVVDHLRDEVNGLAFAPGDKSAMLAAMCRLVRDRALRERLREGALQTAAPLNWSAELDRLDARFRTLVRSVPTGHAPVAPTGAGAAASV